MLIGMLHVRPVARTAPAVQQVSEQRIDRHGVVVPMLYAIGSQLPEYRVKASRCSGSCEPMCDDTQARRYGYRAGLVPGVSIYAYMTRSLLDFLGRDWLERGFAEVAFHFPAYEGEEIRVSGQLASVTKEGALCIEYRAETPQGTVCGAGTARLPAQRIEPSPRLDDYPVGPRERRRPISLQSLKVGEPLAAVRSECDRKTHWEFCEKSVRDHHPLYHQLVHPGWILSQANLILAANYNLPPWIHVSSAVQNFQAQEQECLVETRGRVIEKFEQRGNHFVVLDVAVFARENCLATVRHTAIFRIAPRVA